MSHALDFSSGDFTQGYLSSFLEKDNEIPHYERFYHAKRYVQSRSNLHRSKDAHNGIGRAMGYNVAKGSFHNKLARRRVVYDTLNGDVPFAYLDAIGVDMRELETCAEVDRALFEQEKIKPRYPKHAAVRCGPCVYGRFEFPDGTPEVRALRMLRESDVPMCRWAVIYPELLVIYNAGDGEPGYRFIEPRFEVWKDRLHISSLPSGLFVTRI